MKTRTGFVSNSSSSSFIVTFPQRPISKDDVRDMLFTKYQKEVSIYDMSISTEEAVNLIWDSIQSEDAKMTKEKVRNLFSSLYYSYCYALSDRNSYSIYSILNEEYYTDYIFQDKELFEKYITLYKEEKELWQNSSNDKIDEIMERTSSLRHEINKIEDEIFEIDFKKFLDEVKDRFVGIFHYSDNNGPTETIMEHGNIFSNVESIRISHH